MEIVDFAPDLSLPLVEDDTGIVLTADSIPRPPDYVEAPGLVATVEQHIYDPDFAVRQILLMASKRTFRSLGMLLFGQMVHAYPSLIRIRLAERQDALSSGENNQIVPKHLLVMLPSELRPSSDPQDGELVLRVMSYSYWPCLPDKHPWYPLEDPADLYALPTLNVTNAEGGGAAHPSLEEAIAGFGNLEATIHVASLFLDVSQPASERSEFVLEAEPGFRGVAPCSDEIRLVLPGSLVWSALMLPDFPVE